MSEYEIRNLKQEMSELNDSVSELRDNVKQILSYIENDPNTGREGLFKTSQLHEKKISDLFKLVDKISTQLSANKAYMYGRNTVFGAIGSVVVFIVDHINAIVSFFSHAK